MITLKKDEYIKLVKEFNPKEPRLKNALYAFLSGGFLAFLAELMVEILRKCYAFPESNAYTVVGLTMIFIGSLATVMGFFDDLVMKYKCGLIIPTTGFAHSVASSALDYKKDGLITGLGSNFFKLAGSVLLYGIISSFIFLIGRVIIGV